MVACVKSCGSKNYFQYFINEKLKISETLALPPFPGGRCFHQITFPFICSIMETPFAAEYLIFIFFKVKSILLHHNFTYSYIHKNYEVFLHITNKKGFFWCLLHGLVTITVLSRISKPAPCLWTLCTQSLVP